MILLLEHEIYIGQKIFSLYEESNYEKHMINIKFLIFSIYHMRMIHA